jgi:hypothetical protein
VSLHGIEDLLSEIESLLDAMRHEGAYLKLSRLLNDIGPQEIKSWEVDLRHVIERFYKNKKRDLTSLLEKRLGNEQQNARPKNPLARLSEIQIEAVGKELKNALKELETHHIFQWSTYYRDTILNFYDRFVELAPRIENERLSSIIRAEVSAHTRAILESGYRHQVSRNLLPHFDAISKSVGGLEKFLELPVEVYANKLSVSLTPETGQSMRAVCSAFLAGILHGYATANLGRERGFTLLPNNTRAWVQLVPFLTFGDLGKVTAELAPSEFRSALETGAAILVRSLDQIVQHARDFVPLPALAQYQQYESRLDLAFRPPADADSPQLIEIQCYLTDSTVSRETLQDSVRRGISVVLASLQPDLLELVRRDDRMSEVIVHINDSEPSERISNSLSEAIEKVIYRRRTKRTDGAPITYNCAREFPLRNPVRAKYFHVNRSSVRDLLRAFDRRNGVRLWCSVRRSGKTTACFDLGSTTGGSVIVPQTCDSTEQFPNANLFYDEVCKAVDAGLSVPGDFVQRIVLRCAPNAESDTKRFVFVVDEYETLFGRLRSALRRDPDIRYTVVQPLLNQLVGFSRDHLLVFMGQQPNAHYILMDQNQLSPYVEQDPFPLFQHNNGTITGEFSELMRKVLTDSIRFDGTFADAAYEETAGHPFLTVNLLVELVDWLIDSRRPAKDIRLTCDDFVSFAKDRLTPNRIAMSTEYDFFREAIADAISDESAKTNPWLYSVYRVLGGIGSRVQKGSFSVSQSKYVALTKELGIEQLGIGRDELLRTAAQANFLHMSAEGVQPRIRLLGRIAAAARPRVIA